MPHHPTNEVLPGFRAITFDLDQCRRDLDALDTLLASNRELGERRDILPFFKDHPHLSLFLGSYGTNLDTYDRLAYELDLFGGFKPDVVVGDWVAKNYCFVEFEDARSDSIFARSRGDRKMTVWADRFEGGFSQIVDWFWSIQAHQDSEPFESTFGKRRIGASALLVIGRDSGVVAADRLRLEWRRDHVVVASQKIWCCTFDELLRGLRRKLHVRPVIPVE